MIDRGRRNNWFSQQRYLENVLWPYGHTSHDFKLLLLALLFYDKYDNFHLKTNSCLCRERKWSSQGYFSLPNSVQEKSINRFVFPWKGLHFGGERPRTGVTGRKTGTLGHRLWGFPHPHLGVSPRRPFARQNTTNAALTIGFGLQKRMWTLFGLACQLSHLLLVPPHPVRAPGFTRDENNAYSTVVLWGPDESIHVKIFKKYLATIKTSINVHHYHRHHQDTSFPWNYSCHSIYNKNLSTSG